MGILFAGVEQGDPMLYRFAGWVCHFFTQCQRGGGVEVGIIEARADNRNFFT